MTEVEESRATEAKRPVTRYGTKALKASNDQVVRNYCFCIVAVLRVACAGKNGKCTACMR